jgi:hypothetical protein
LQTGAIRRYDEVVKSFIELPRRKPGFSFLRTNCNERIARMADGRKVCPECPHVFKGNGWDGIDAHWKSKHEGVMPYEDAWPLIKSGNYKRPGATKK